MRYYGRYRRRRYTRGHGAYYLPRVYRAPRVRGHGAYSLYGLGQRAKKAWGWARRASKGYGKKIGKFVGGSVGAALDKRYGNTGIFEGAGKAIGGFMGNTAAKVTGFGDYTVTSNTLLGRQGHAPPTFGEDSIRVRKTEYITNINMTDDFQVSTFPINPGLKQTFPWLSNIAANYEQFYMHGMIFMYKTTSSAAIASDTDLGLGQVIMATDYDALDAEFQNQSQMLGSMFSNSTIPSHSLMHAVECDNKAQPYRLYYVRQGDPPANSDLRLYDPGKFGLATNGPANYTGAGQLWVSYDISFYKSVQNVQLGFGLSNARWTFDATNTSPSPGLFASAAVTELFDNIGMTLDSAATTITVNFPGIIDSGFFRCSLAITSKDSANVSVITISDTTGLVAVKAYPSDNSDSSVADTELLLSPSAGELSDTCYLEFIVKLQRYAASITLTFATYTMANCYGTFSCEQLNGSFYNSYGTTIV